MKIIFFTNRKGTTFQVSIDDEDSHLLAKKGWYCTKNGNTYYLRNDSIYNKRVYFHRLVLSCPKGVFVDHINGNGLDNRKSNLRLCTKQQNHFNSKKRSGATSNFLGVSWDKNRKRWYAHIMVNYKSLALGRFLDEKEAAKAYNQAATKYFGEFAKLNVL